MSRSQRLKGVNAERELVRYFRDVRGYHARRVPLSGALAHEKGDVIIEVPALDGDGVNRTTFEAKVRKDGFKQLYDWIDGHDALAIRADRKGWLIVTRVEDWEP